jgi:hypothetical protein
MKSEYCVHTDVLQTIVASARVEPRHTALLAALATRTEFRSTAYVTSRDTYVAHPGKVFDASGGLIADSYHDWIESKIAANNGDTGAVWERYKDKGYLLSEVQPVLHFFAYDRDGAQDNLHDYPTRELEFRVPPICTDFEIVTIELQSALATKPPEDRLHLTRPAGAG